jgi:hypothetical protein
MEHAVIFTIKNQKQKKNRILMCILKINENDNLKLFIIDLYVLLPGSSVGIVTAYGLVGPGIEFRWGRDFPHLSRPALRPTQSPVQWVQGLSGRKVRPWRDADPSPPSNAEVKNRVELYIYSP